MAKFWMMGFKRLLSLAAAAAALAAITTPVAAKTLTYVTESTSQEGAYVVDWRAGGRARTVDWRGAQVGTVTDDGTQQLITLDGPLSYENYSAGDDCGGTQYLQRYETRQLVFRHLEGSANVGKTAVVEIGAVVDIGGCAPGRTVPFGSPTDAGTRMLHRAYGSRAPMTDVLAGFNIAGFYEAPLGPGDFSHVPADIVTLDSATSARFHATGTVAAAALSADKWLVLQMPGFQRGYTRLSIHAASTTETWLVGDFVAGKLQTVRPAMMVKPVAGTTFGSLGQTARMWESLVGMGSDNPFFIYLYRTFTGERVSKDLIAGTESRVPITWRYDGTNIVQTRPSGGRTRERTWVPLASNGSYRVVMEQEWSLSPGTPPEVFIPPRIMYYRNTGVATPPP